MLAYDAIKSWPFEESRQTVSNRDVILYALGLGIGSDPLDHHQLRYLYEPGLRVIPSMASVLCAPSRWVDAPDLGLDHLRIVHGEQDVTIHAPLPTEGQLSATTRITRIVDKGASKGALYEQVRDIFDSRGNALATVRQVNFARGNGGYSISNGRSDDPPVNLPGIPERDPDYEIVMGSLPQAALVYRLSGDLNPLHADPTSAHKAGYPRPILHGLCTYGMATFAVIRKACDGDEYRLKRMAARFSAPVYPGEVLTFQIWHAGYGKLHLRARVDQRDTIVLTNGWFEYH